MPCLCFKEVQNLAKPAYIILARSLSWEPCDILECWFIFGCVWVQLSEFSRFWRYFDNLLELGFSCKMWLRPDQVCLVWKCAIPGLDSQQSWESWVFAHETAVNHSSWTCWLGGCPASVLSPTSIFLNMMSLLCRVAMVLLAWYRAEQGGKGLDDIYSWEGYL